jgi:phage-related protein
MAVGFQDLTGTNRVPDRTMSNAIQPRVLKVQFGDGYEQRIQDGINNLKQEFSVTFNNRPKAEIDDIVAFLNNKAGTTAFNFTYPDSNAGGGETTIKVVCEDWSQRYSYDDFYSASMKFRRVYEP